jgi:hypothetical protein
MADDKPKRRTAEERARAERIKRLAFRLAIAREQIGQVWRDAEYPETVEELRAMEVSLGRIELDIAEHV